MQPTFTLRKLRSFFCYALFFIVLLCIFRGEVNAQGTVSTSCTTFANNNANYAVSFNFKNNNLFDVYITEIWGICDTTDVTNVSAWIKSSGGVNGDPVPISAGNGWTQFGSATIMGIKNQTDTIPQLFMSGLTQKVGAGATVGIVVQAVRVNGRPYPANLNLRYATIFVPGVYTCSAGGCDIITGDNIGYGMFILPGNVPIPPAGTIPSTFTPRGFLGRVVFGLTPPCAGFPVLTLSATKTELMPGEVTTISVASAPAGVTYVWKFNGVTIPGATTNSIVRDVDGIGTYRVTVTDINTCTNTSDSIVIKPKVTDRCFCYPNPAPNGQFQVRLYSGTLFDYRNIRIYNSIGKLVYKKELATTGPYQRMDVNFAGLAAGVYIIKVTDENETKEAICKMIIPH